MKVLSLFLRERKMKEPATSKFSRCGFVTWIDKTLLAQPAGALQSLVPPCCAHGLIQGMGVLLPSPATAAWEL